MKIFERRLCSDLLTIYPNITLDIDLSVIASSSVPASDVTFPTINYQWAKATDVDVENYRNGTQSRLSYITIPVVVYCNDVWCMTMTMTNVLLNINAYRDSGRYSL